MALVSTYFRAMKRILRNWAQRAMYVIVQTRKVEKHPDTFLKFEELGTIYFGYSPTYNIEKPYINENHKFLTLTSLYPLHSRFKGGRQIWGALRIQDALKLYELAFFASGDILELGTRHGLSTCIMSRAHYDSPYRKWIYSVEVNPRCVEITKENLIQEHLDKRVSVLCEDALSAVQRMAAEGKKFQLVFVDHSHAYEDVYQICREIGSVLSRGGFCLFHDFNDPRNQVTDETDYGVYQAVMDGLDFNRFEFFGTYGACGLFRHIR